MTVGSLFSGIGGLDLGLERASMTVRWQVENDPYCVAVLEKHWPGVRRWDDAKTFPPDTKGNLWGTPGHDGSVAPDWCGVDLVCGGFPCQPVSVAGKRLGRDDPRWLWPEFARIIRVLRPRYVLVENVPGLLVRGFGDVLGDLAACGYDAEWDCLPAAAVGAPHLRYRVFLVAYARCGVSGSSWNGGDQRGTDAPSASGQYVAHTNAINGEGLRALRKCSVETQLRPIPTRRIFQSLPDTDGQSLGRIAESRGQRGDWLTEPDVGRVAHGVPARVDRLRALGNAVVPQVAEWVGRQILAFDQTMTPGATP